MAITEAEPAQAQPPPQTPPQTPRKLPRDERRVQLMEATIRAMARQGYARVTMGEVAREAGLSHGLVNFHFASKANLLLETLLYLAEEYRLNWTLALAEAGPSAADQLHAMLAADFNPRICAPDRLSAWCAFWGESQSRPLYQERCGENDAMYNMAIEALCARMITEYGYPHMAERVGRILRATVEGVWLEMITVSTPFDVAEARATVMTLLAAFFPRHFDETGLRGDLG